MYNTDFDKINKVLVNTRQLWQHRSFFDIETPWEKHHPALLKALHTLSINQAEQLAKDNNALLAWFTPYLSIECEQLATLKVAQSAHRTLTLNPHHSVAIPGRKWQQIKAFNSAIPELKHPVVEWCSGKAHLGRIIARSHQQKVYSLELNSSLCNAGQALAKNQKVDIELIHHNVLRPLPIQARGTDRAHIGLHACGELHMTLLKTAASERSQQIAISPCCYHKINQDYYPSLSSQAQRAGLILTKEDLHLTQEETVTAGNRVQQLRHKEQVWRLAFDLLQREQQGVPRYQAIPSTPKAIFSGGFKNFCEWAAQSFGLTLTQGIDYNHYLALGEKRREQVVKLDLVRQLFRRPMELWLALDRVLFLEEQGYDVNLTEFCERHTTPRNLLIYAQR